MAGAALTLLSGGAAFAATKPAWFMTASNVQSLSQTDSATASHFFNTASAYGAGASLIKTPVQAGYATTPVLNYTSYAQFSSDISSGAINYPYKWVMYDPEDWSQTPVNEQQDPVKYMELFGQLAHAHGLKVVEAPAMDLCSVSPAPTTPGCPVRPAHSGTPGSTSPAPPPPTRDIFVLQDESNTTNLSQYVSLYTSAAAQAQAANSGRQGLLRGLHGQRHRGPDDRGRRVDQPERDVRRRTRRHRPGRPVLPEHAGSRLLNPITPNPPRGPGTVPGPRRCARIL